MLHSVVLIKIIIVSRGQINHYHRLESHQFALISNITCIYRVVGLTRLTYCVAPEQLLLFLYPLDFYDLEDGKP